MPTGPVMAGNEREENPPRLPTLRGAALASAREKNSGHPSDQITRGKKFLLYGPRNYTEECKLLKEQSAKYAVQKPQN